MLLLRKKLNSLAIVLIALSPVVVSTIQARADEPVGRAEGVELNLPARFEQPAIPRATQTQVDAPVVATPISPPVIATVPAPAAPNLPQPLSLAVTLAAPTPAPAPALNGSTPRPIQETEVSRFISGFRVRKITDENGTKLSVIGLGHPACLRHLKFQFDRPVDDNTGNYAIRVTKRDIVNGSGQTLRTDEDCTIERTRQCTRDPESGCVSINDSGIAEPLGIAALQDTQLTEDGKIMFRFDDLARPEGDPSAVSFREIPRQMGGPLDYKSPETIAAEMARRRLEERNQLLVSTCKDAEKGSRDALEALKEQMGPEGIVKNAKFIERLEKKVNQNELAELQKKLDAAETIEALNGLIDEAQEFARSHPDMKQDVIRFLVDGIGKKALELDTEGDTNRIANAKLKLAERALKVAYGLDRKNQNLRKAYAVAKLERLKFLSNTGDDRFYNETTRREAMNAYRDVRNWASRSRDPEAAGVARDYARAFADRPVPIAYNTPQGPQVVGYMPGTSLDETFVKRSLEEEFNTYRQSILSDGIGSGYRGNFGGNGNGGLSGGGNGGLSGSGNNRF